MCFEFEIPNKKKEKKAINEDYMEIESELEKVEEPVTIALL
jgi:hypothetical protein